MDSEKSLKVLRIQFMIFNGFDFSVDQDLELEPVSYVVLVLQSER